MNGPLWRALLAMAVVALCLGAAACRPPIALSGDADIVLTVDEIIANPQRYAGHQVVVDAQVDRVLGERVIALRAQTSAQSVLVIVGGQALRGVNMIEPGDVLHLAGVVRVMSRDEIRQVELQLGIQLDEEKLLSLANQAPFLVATKVSKRKS